MNKIAGWPLLERLSLALASAVFVAWLLLFYDGYHLAEDVNHAENFNEITTFLIFFLLGTVLFLPFAGVTLRGNAKVAFGLVALGSWLEFLIAWRAFLASPVADPLTAPEINMGMFIIHHYWEFMIPGAASLLFLISIVHWRIERAERTGRSAGMEILVAVASCLCLAALHQVAFAWDIQFILGISCLAFLLPVAWFTRKESRDHPLVGHRNAFFGILLFAVILLLLAFGTWIGTTTLFFLSSELGVLLLAAGMFVPVAACEAVDHVPMPRWLKASSPFITLCSAIGVAIVEFYLVYSGSNGSDSTYDTNPANLPGVFLAGVVLGLLFSAINLHLTRFKQQEGRTSRRYAHEMGRWLLAAALPCAIFIGLQQGMDEKPFDTNIVAYTSLGIPVLGGILVVVAVLTGLGTRLKRIPLVIPKEPTLVQDNRVPAVQGRGKKLLSVSMLLLIGGSAAVTLIPQFFITPDAMSGYPNYLGSVGSCTINEVSPLTKVGRNDLIPAPIQNSGENPLVHRSMARNEFETVQVVLSNWGMAPVRVTGVTISNSSHGGLETAFSRPDANKAWKGQGWAWPRFLPQYVDEIQPGCPDIIYKLDGNQTSAQLVTGSVEARPQPVIQPGANLAL
ncbi:MAG: hypothetical protein JW839_12965, partial [Candidatus Lokiarchaeota archaeon]|nr:hypothetical protein [Candidatus Lokiarchaeota archaeon]